MENLVLETHIERKRRNSVVVSSVAQKQHVFMLDKELRRGFDDMHYKVQSNYGITILQLPVQPP